jgi:hypothetical protein
MCVDDYSFRFRISCCRIYRSCSASTLEGPAIGNAVDDGCNVNATAKKEWEFNCSLTYLLSVHVINSKYYVPGTQYVQSRTVEFTCFTKMGVAADRDDGVGRILSSLH